MEFGIFNLMNRRDRSHSPAQMIAGFISAWPIRRKSLSNSMQEKSRDSLNIGE